ncbi:MAG: hypothetical protein ACO3NZ_07115 [Pirellulales bacterium]
MNCPPLGATCLHQGRGWPLTLRLTPRLSLLLALGLSLGLPPGTVSPASATTTWDGRHETDRIDVTVVYFVPSDRDPLPDWRDRVDYYCRRIEQFHEVEFQGLSTLTTQVIAEPLVSKRTTAQLRQGDGDAIFFTTLRETAERLAFANGQRDGFPVLLVLSEINWRPLDDFYRVKPTDTGFVFEGNFNRGEHFPGATSGGARATYLADRGVGWGLVSADGWRVPYRGSDCVIYHEGCGHTVGLPHPEPGNGSVMSLGQYQGWISESWLDKEQKIRLGWEPQDRPATPQQQLFRGFRAVPEPKIPTPGQPVALQLRWPSEVEVTSVRVRYQTSLHSPWVDVPQTWEGRTPQQATLPPFDRETPVSYRIDVETADGSSAELWGYFQVRTDPTQPLLPPRASLDIAGPPTPLAIAERVGQATDLLAGLDLADCWQQGDWTLEDGTLTSPKMYGARLQLPAQPPQAYRLIAIVEPLDPPNGLILGQRLGTNRCVSLFGYSVAGQQLTAIENIDGRNVGNETTHRGDVFRQNQLSQVIVTVGSGRVQMAVDGQTVVDWQGTPEQLSLSDYWQTPDATSLFLGSYDCRYRFHRLSLEPLAERR